MLFRTGKQKGFAMQTGIKPKVIEEIKDIAQKCGVRKVILFGSRARGDYQRASDIDLAVYGGSIVEFTLEVKEETSTLLDFDVVNLDEPVQEKLLEAIERDGVTIYEKV